VDFLDGDIDRPIITAGLYNGNHRPPSYSGAGDLPVNRPLTSIKSKECKGNGYNGLLFDDSTSVAKSQIQIKTWLKTKHTAQPI